MFVMGCLSKPQKTNTTQNKTYKYCIYTIGYIEVFIVEIFKNYNVLTIPYVPERREDIIARDEQCEQMIRHLSVISRGRNPDNVMIYGRCGTGKSLLAKFFTKKMVEEKGHIRVYVNCETHNTTYRILKKIADTVSGKQVIPKSGLPLGECYDRLWEALRTEKYVVIILDEVDKLRDTNLLYCIPRAVENEDLDRMNISIIGITNSLKFKEERLDARILSSFGRKEIVFPAYDANQLREILNNRAKSAFFDGVLDSSVIPLCAALSVSGGYGDAREAISLLRVAGEIAERQQSSMVKEEHVRAAQAYVEHDRIAEVIEKLPSSLKLVLYAITHLSESDSEINTGKVYDCYQRLCRQIGIDFLSRVRVTNIISELDLLGIINAKVRYMGRYGRTREIHLDVPRVQTQELLLEDTMLRPLKGLRLMRAQKGQTKLQV